MPSRVHFLPNKLCLIYLNVIGWFWIGRLTEGVENVHLDLAVLMCTNFVLIRKTTAETHVLVEPVILPMLSTLSNQGCLIQPWLLSAVEFIYKDGRRR